MKKLTKSFIQAARKDIGRALLLASMYASAGGAVVSGAALAVRGTNEALGAVFEAAGISAPSKEARLPYMVGTAMALTGLFELQPSVRKPAPEEAPASTNALKVLLKAKGQYQKSP